MKIALFIPCYVDHLYPEVATSVVKIFTAIGLDFSIPRAQTCCGQPLLNSGFAKEARDQVARHNEVFQNFDYVVTPSGSCASVLRENSAGDAAKTWELCEFLHDVVKLDSWKGTFPQKVALHRSCQGARSLSLGGATELGKNPACKVTALLRKVGGLELVELPARSDECCGFGGSFSVLEPSVSAGMGLGRLELFLNAGANTVTATDMGCLAHLEGLIRKRGYPLQTKHVAQVLAESLA